MRREGRKHKGKSEVSCPDVHVPQQKHLSQRHGVTTCKCVYCTENTILEKLEDGCYFYINMEGRPSGQMASKEQRNKEGRPSGQMASKEQWNEVG